MVGVHTNLLAPQVKGKLACVLQKKQLVEEKKQCANLAARIIFWLSTRDSEQKIPPSEFRKKAQLFNWLIQKK